jgi:hypothetical protein
MEGFEMTYFDPIAMDIHWRNQHPNTGETIMGLRVQFNDEHGERMETVYIPSDVLKKIREE